MSIGCIIVTVYITEEMLGIFKLNINRIEEAKLSSEEDVSDQVDARLLRRLPAVDQRLAHLKRLSPLRTKLIEFEI
jgi:hypothetical protein